MNAKQRDFESTAVALGLLAEDADTGDQYQALKMYASLMREAAQGHARYEALRLRNPHTYAELIERNIAGEAFDDMLDELVKAKNEP